MKAREVRRRSWWTSTVGSVRLKMLAKSLRPQLGVGSGPARLTRFLLETRYLYQHRAQKRNVDYFHRPQILPLPPGKQTCYTTHKGKYSALLHTDTLVTLGIFVLVLGVWVYFFLATVNKKEKDTRIFSTCRRRALLGTCPLLVIRPLFHFC